MNRGLAGTLIALEAFVLGALVSYRVSVGPFPVIIGISTGLLALVLAFTWGASLEDYS